MRSTEGLPSYSTLEVSKHSTADDAWLIISGKVLNITPWLEEHPGGDDVLLDLAGRDATREFEDVGHSGDARSRLDELVIGTVRPTTDEELRVSRTRSAAGEKAASVSAAAAAALRGMMDEHAAALGRFGVVGLTGGVMLALALAVRRYGASLSPWGRR